MTPDEIRSFGLEHRDPEITVTGNVQDCASMLREAAAQLAELNQVNKPRWVNLNDYGDPLLVNAVDVIGLSCGYASNGIEPPTRVVYIRMRGCEAPVVVSHLDHDEVRGLLGIGEDWMNPIVKPPTGGRYMTEADYAEAMAIIDTARRVANDPEMLKVPTGAARDNLDRLTQLFDSYDSLPF